MNSIKKVFLEELKMYINYPGRNGIAPLQKAVDRLISNTPRYYSDKFDRMIKQYKAYKREQ